MEATMVENETKSIKESKNDYNIIHIKTEGGKNPRKEGSHGYKSFSVITEGMTVRQYREAGGRTVDLAWDIKHGYLELEKVAAPEKPAKEKKAKKEAEPAAAEPQAAAQ
jgi:hypothetical protein